MGVIVKFSIFFIFLIIISNNILSQEIDLSKEVRRKINVLAPRNEVYKRMTTSEGLKKVLTVDCNIEMKVGGKWEIYFLSDADSGKKGTEGCKVLSFIPNQMVSFTWKAPPNFDKIQDQFSWVVINFEEVNKNETKVELVHLGWKNDPHWDRFKDYSGKTWERILTWLSASFKDK